MKAGMKAGMKGENTQRKTNDNGHVAIIAEEEKNDNEKNKINGEKENDDNPLLAASSPTPKDFPNDFDDCNPNSDASSPNPDLSDPFGFPEYDSPSPDDLRQEELAAILLRDEKLKVQHEHQTILGVSYKYFIIISGTQLLTYCNLLIYSPPSESLLRRTKLNSPYLEMSV
jgi:hypothetical protein